MSAGIGGIGGGRLDPIVTAGEDLNNSEGAEAPGLGLLRQKGRREISRAAWEGKRFCAKLGFLLL